MMWVSEYSLRPEVRDAHTAGLEVARKAWRDGGSCGTFAFSGLLTTVAVDVWGSTCPSDSTLVSQQRIGEEKGNDLPQFK
jgi:hypothetical protein